MATLIKSIADFKKYVSVNQSVEWDSVKPYVLQSERKFLKSVTGKLIYDNYINQEPTNATEKQVYELLREASANLTCFLYLPLAQVQITDSGISVAAGQNYKSAEWWQFRDLRRSFVDGGFQAIDEALSIMELNSGPFSNWRSTDEYTVFNEMFVNKTEIFNKWFNISNSRRTFLALKPTLLESQFQYFKKLDNTTIATIKSAENDITKEVLKLIQAAQVSYCVSKVASSGTFDLTSSGIYQKIEEFPGYKIKTLGADMLFKLEQSRLTAAEEYYKEALILIKENPTEFPNMVIKTATTFVKPKNTKSIVSF